MKIMIDANVLLDVLACREPFFSQSQKVLQYVAEGKGTGGMTANMVTDIHYILRKHLDAGAIKAALRGLMELLEVVSVTEAECLAALDSPIKDYEDALLSCCAAQWRGDVIVTRNEKDFVGSRVKAQAPEDFLKSIE